MRRPGPLLFLLAPLLAAVEPCGGGDDETRYYPAPDDTDADADSDADGDTDADSDADTDSGGGGGGDDTFLSVEVTCEGDSTEWTWTYRASLAFQASYVTVEVDAGAPDYEAWYLDNPSNDGTEWETEVTELLSGRTCSRAATLSWSAFGFGEWEETYESTYTP